MARLVAPPRAKGCEGSSWKPRSDGTRAEGGTERVTGGALEARTQRRCSATSITWSSSLATSGGQTGCDGEGPKNAPGRKPGMLVGRTSSAATRPSKLDSKWSWSSNNVSGRRSQRGGGRQCCSGQYLLVQAWPSENRHWCSGFPLVRQVEAAGHLAISTCSSRNSGKEARLLARVSK